MRFTERRPCGVFQTQRLHPVDFLAVHHSERQAQGHGTSARVMWVYLDKER
jgi:hypothetical protein